MLRSRRFIFVLLLLLCWQAQATPSCRSTLSLSPTQSVLIEELSRLRIKLDQNLANGDLSFSVYTEMNKNYFERKTELEKELAASGLVLDQLLFDRISALQKNDQHLAIEEDQISESQITLLHAKVQFHFVPKGQFQVEQPGPGASYTYPEYRVERDFYLMETLLSQEIWFELVKVVDTDGSIGKIHFKPEGLDMPANNITGLQIDIFLENLNKTSSSANVDIQKKMSLHLVGHQPGDHYRLPRREELAYVVQEGGKFDENYYRENTDEILDHGGWLFKGSRRKPHAVMFAEPLLRFERKYYDFWGNLGQYVVNDRDNNYALAAGIDYRNSTDALWLQSNAEAISHFRINKLIGKSQRSDTIGIRLVRERD